MYHSERVLQMKECSLYQRRRLKWENHFWPCIAIQCGVMRLLRCAWILRRTFSSAREWLCGVSESEVQVHRTRERHEYVRKGCYYSPAGECVERILIFGRLQHRNKQLAGGASAEINIRKSFVVWMGVANIICLCNKREMMWSVDVFCWKNSKAIRQKTHKILVTGNMREHDWIVELQRDTTNVLVKLEHIWVW